MASAQGDFPVCCIHYDPVAAVENLRALPRFGYTSDFSVLAGDDPESKKEYIVGTLLTALLILITMAVWIVLLIVLPCLGREKTGFLSGARMLAGSKRPRRVRITFLTCAAIVITFTVLLGTKGVNSFYETTQSMTEMTLRVQNISAVADKSLGGLLESLEKAQNATDTVIDNLADFCIQNQFLRNQAERLVAEVVPVQDFEPSLISDLQQTARSIHQTSVTAEATVQKVEKNIVFELLFRAPVFIFSILFIIGVVLAWMRKSPPLWEKVMKYFFMPLFTLLMLASWILCCVFAVAAVMNADVCAGGPAPGNPTNTVRTFFKERNGIDPTDPASQTTLALFEYYFACGQDIAFSTVVDLLELLQEAKVEAEQFLSSLGDSAQTGICVVDVALSDENLRKLLQFVTVVIALLLTLTAALACTSITPVYNLTVNESLCTHNVTAFAWAFGSMLVISVCGTTMLMLRSALWKDEEQHDDGANIVVVAGKQVDAEEGDTGGKREGFPDEPATTQTY